MMTASLNQPNFSMSSLSNKSTYRRGSNAENGVPVGARAANVPVRIDDASRSNSDGFINDSKGKGMAAVQEVQQHQQQPKERQQQQQRKSQRERVSTTMKINGYTVLRKNNYVVKGLQYIYDTFKPDVDVDVDVNATKSNSKTNSKYLTDSTNSNSTDSTSATTAKTNQKPLSQAQIQNQKRLQNRMKHNEHVKLQMRKDEIKRWAFLKHNLSLLDPFIVDKVRTKFHIQQHQQENNVPRVQVPQLSFFDYKLKSQPSAVKTQLRDYQRVGLQWMINMNDNGLSMILGDEMGLGKTLQTISLIAHLKQHSDVKSPCLVICPLSVLYSWCNEITKHAPSLKYFRLHASGSTEREDQKQTMSQHILEYDIIITTYEMAKSREIQNLVRNVYFHLLVLDEGHIIKDITTQTAAATRKIHARNKLILTGTPLQNNLVELHAILNFLYPQVFTEDVYFRDAFDIGKNAIDKDMLLKANKMLELFMLRRLKEEVEKLMPKKIETKIMCPLSTAQIFWYKGYLMKDIDAIVRASDEEEAGTTTANRHKILSNLIMQLRKCCLHPYLFPAAEVNVESTSIQELIAASGKLAILDKMLRSMYQNGNRTVIFSQFTSMLDILDDYCTMRGWKFCRFDGSTPRAQRNFLINQFNAPGSDYFIFLMSTRSGGLGINLQTADTCILYDSDWNPQPDIQAMARVHRIGQKKVVHVYRLVSAGTVEERVLQRAEKKLFLDQMVNRGAKGVKNDLGDDSEGGGLTTSELLSALKFGSNAIFRSTNDLPSDEEINIITDRNRSEETSSGSLKGDAVNSASTFNVDQELNDTQTFEGIDFRRIRENQKKVGKRNQMMSKLKEEWRESHIVTDDNGGRGKRNKMRRIMNIKDDNGTFRQVLSVNNYDLENGEPSVFAKETLKTSGMSNPKRKKNECAFENQDFCQICGDGGSLVCCPLCPISVHAECCGVKPKNFAKCTHHRCSVCDKSNVGAGGLLFLCQSCPNAYCDECLPKKDVRILGNSIPRFEKLQYEGNPRSIYIHCSKQCESYAKSELGWCKRRESKMRCPDQIDVSYAFGSKALSVKEIARVHAGFGKKEMKKVDYYDGLGKKGIKKEHSPEIISISSESDVNLNDDTITSSSDEISSDRKVSIVSSFSSRTGSYGSSSSISIGNGSNQNTGGSSELGPPNKISGSSTNLTGTIISKTIGSNYLPNSKKIKPSSPKKRPLEIIEID